MSTTKEGSSRDAGDKLPVPGACGSCIVSTAAAVSQVFQIRESGRVPQVEVRLRAERCEGRRPFQIASAILPCTAVGARLLWRLVTAKVLRQAARATTKVVTGFVPVQVKSLPRWTAWAVPVASSLVGRCERASRERLGRLWHDVVAASLPLGAVLGATSMGSSSRLGLLSKVRRLFG